MNQDRKDLISSFSQFNNHNTMVLVTLFSGFASQDAIKNAPTYFQNNGDDFYNKLAIEQAYTEALRLLSTESLSNAEVLEHIAKYMSNSPKPEHLPKMKSTHLYAVKALKVWTDLYDKVKKLSSDVHA